MLHAAQVRVASKSSDFQAQAASVFTNAVKLNGSVNNNSKGNIPAYRTLLQEQPFDLPKANNLAASLYKNFTCLSCHWYVMLMCLSLYH